MLTIERKTLSNALAALKPAINRRSLVPVLTYVKATYADGTLTLAIRNEEHNIETSLPCVLLSETPPDGMGFNPDFLRSIVQAAHRKGEVVTVVMEFTTPTCPLKFTTPEADPAFVSALMPMFLGE